MLISIITPVYNGASHLPSLFKYVTQQTFDNWELILINDGSTDDSPALCDQLAAVYPDHIRVIHQLNGGVSTARNAGLNAARGKYIGFIDCDDGIRPDMFKKLTDAAERDNSDLVMGGYQKINDEGDSTPVSLPFDGTLESDSAEKVAYSMAFWGGYYKGEELTTLYGSVWPNLYRSDIIRKYNIKFPVGISIGEDTIFNLIYLSHSNRITSVNEPLYLYNVSTLSATRKRNPQLWDRYKNLLNESVKALRENFGENIDLQYNLCKQYINFAISVAEEQLCVFYSGKDLKKQLKSLCADPILRDASRYIMKNGHSLKVRIQALILYRKLVSLMSLWLSN